MQTPELVLQIEKIQHHDSQVMADVITQFMPLIKKYSKLLRYEDAEQDMIVSFIELLYAIPLEDIKQKGDNMYMSLLSYIKVSVRNRYIELSKKQRHLTNNENVCSEEEELERYPSGEKVEDIELSLDMRRGLQKLNERQRTILLARYVYGYSDAEISDYLGITRQAVNRARNRAFEKLKETLHHT